MLLAGITRALEGVSIALESIRANKGRAALTILGVAVGVFVVVALSSVVRGVNESFARDVAAAGPTSFFVYRRPISGFRAAIRAIPAPARSAAIRRSRTRKRSASGSCRRSSPSRSTSRTVRTSSTRTNRSAPASSTTRPIGPTSTAATFSRDAASRPPSTTPRRAS